MANGGIGVLPPTTLRDDATGTEQVVSEVVAYGDVVLRYVSGSFQVQTQENPNTKNLTPKDAYGGTKKP